MKSPLLLCIFALFLQGFSNGLPSKEMPPSDPNGGGDDPNKPASSSPSWTSGKAAMGAASVLIATGVGIASFLSQKKPSVSDESLSIDNATTAVSMGKSEQNHRISFLDFFKMSSSRSAGRLERRSSAPGNLHHGPTIVSLDDRGHDAPLVRGLRLGLGVPDCDDSDENSGSDRNAPDRSTTSCQFGGGWKWPYASPLHTALNRKIIEKSVQNQTVNSWWRFSRKTDIVKKKRWEIKFESFADEQFARIGDTFSSLDFRDSFMSNEQLISVGALANSGSHFFYTIDGKYIIKTIPKGQALFLLHILDSYCKFIQENPDSSLIRIHGLFHVSWKSGGPSWLSWSRNSGVFMIVMQNTLYNQHVAGLTPKDNIEAGRKINEKVAIYDLKGYGLKHSQDMKDFKKWNKEKKCLHLSKDSKNKITTGVLKDLEYLGSIGVNDYSLLLGVMEKPVHRPSSIPISEGNQFAHETDNGMVVFIGVIDCLSSFDHLRRAGSNLPLVRDYYPRFMHPKSYADRMRMTLDKILDCS